MFVEARRPTEKGEEWKYGDIVYIGKTYQQSFKQRINQHMRGVLGSRIKEKAKMPVVVKVSYIDCITKDKISKKQVEEIEKFLIDLFNPRANKHARYSGERGLIITNSGAYKPLRKVCSTDDLWLWPQ